MLLFASRSGLERGQGQIWASDALLEFILAHVTDCPEDEYLAQVADLDGPTNNG